MHQVDLFATIAHAVGGAVPKDRAIDSVNMLPFFEGRQAKSEREGFPIYIGGAIRAVKWRDWKLHYAWHEESGQPLEKVSKRTPEPYVPPASAKVGGMR